MRMADNVIEEDSMTASETETENRPGGKIRYGGAGGMPKYSLVFRDERKRCRRR